MLPPAPTGTTSTLNITAVKASKLARHTDIRLWGLKKTKISLLKQSFSLYNPGIFSPFAPSSGSLL
jgi:hypothetical protein